METSKVKFIGGPAHGEIIEIPQTFGEIWMIPYIQGCENILQRESYQISDIRNATYRKAEEGFYLEESLYFKMKDQRKSLPEILFDLIIPMGELENAYSERKNYICRQ